MSTVTPYHLDRVLDNFFNSTYPVARTSAKTYEQHATESAYTLTIPMIGVTKTDLDITVSDGKLVVSAVPSVKSRWSTEFNYTWNLSEYADVDNINARLENGLLTLTIPRLKPDTKKVSVTVQ